MSKFTVNSLWTSEEIFNDWAIANGSSKFFGVDAFGSIQDALDSAASNEITTIALAGDFFLTSSLSYKSDIVFTSEDTNTPATITTCPQSIKGTAESALRNISFDNLTIVASDASDFIFDLDYISGFEVSNCSFIAPNGLSAIYKSASDDRVSDLVFSDNTGAAAESLENAGSALSVAPQEAPLPIDLLNQKLLANSISGSVAPLTLRGGATPIIYDGGTYDDYIYGGMTTPGEIDDCGDMHLAGDIDITIKDGVYSRVYGGNYVYHGWDYYCLMDGDITLTIEGGQFNGMVGAGDVVANESFGERTGSITTNISGGVFNKIVAGGMTYLGTDVASAIMNGDISLSISGGTFNNKVFGASLSAYKSLSQYLTTNGQVTLTIDSSQNAVTFADGVNIVAGTSGEGYLNGNLTVRLTGLGENLTFNGILCVANESTLRVIATNTFETSVKGTRKLILDNFTGNFDGSLRAMDSIDVINGTAINFTSGQYLGDPSNWLVESGCSLAGIGSSNFKGDSLVFDFDSLTEDWTVMKGTRHAFTDIASAASVKLGGQNATWNTDETAWCSTSYKLYVDTDGAGKQMIIAAR